MAIAIGVMLFVAFMAMVMGFPLSYYLHRDQEYLESARLSEQARLHLWYH